MWSGAPAWAISRGLTMPSGVSTIAQRRMSQPSKSSNLPGVENRVRSLHLGQKHPVRRASYCGVHILPVRRASERVDPDYPFLLRFGLHISKMCQQEGSRLSLRFLGDRVLKIVDDRVACELLGLRHCLRIRGGYVENGSARTDRSWHTVASHQSEDRLLVVDRIGRTTWRRCLLRDTSWRRCASRRWSG